MYIAPTAILDRYSFDLEPFQHLEKHIHLGSAEIILQGTIRIWIVEVGAADTEPPSICKIGTRNGSSD